MKCEMCGKACDELNQGIGLPGLYTSPTACRDRMVCDDCDPRTQAAIAVLAQVEDFDLESQIDILKMAIRKLKGES